MVTAIPSTQPPKHHQPKSEVAPLRLEIVGGEYDGRMIELLSKKISIGSGQSSTLRLVGCGLKAVELFIIRGERHTVVRNWSPGNQINGRSFTDAILRSGDRLSVGSVEFVVSALEPAATPPEDTNSSDEARAESNTARDYLATQVIDRAEAETIEELDQVRSQVAELREQLQSHYDDASNDLAQWQREREQWIDELADSRQQTIAANHDLDAVTTQRDALQEKLSALEAKLDELANSQAEEVQVDPEQLARLVEQSEANAAQRQQLADEIEEANQRLAEMQQKYDAIHGAAEAATVAIGEAECRIQELEAELAAVRGAQPTLVSNDNESTETDEELLARIEEVEAREKELVEKAEQLEEAAFQIELMKEEFEEERAALVKRAEEGRNGPAAVGEDQERALVELLQLREQLDRQSAELEQRENELAERERSIGGGGPDAAIHHADQLQQPVEDEHDASHTIMLDNQDDSAMTLAQRILGQPAENDGIAPVEESFSGEADESIDDVVLGDSQGVEAIDTTGEEGITEADSASPVNAAAILKKYAGDNLYEDLDNDVEPEPVASETVESVASAEEEKSDSDGDDDSIRDYMAQLMRRVSGESSRMPAETDGTVDGPSNEGEPAPELEPATERPMKQEEAFEVMASREYTPRSSAPEKSDNLAKMREVAMNSAHNAITAASRRRQTQAAVIHFVMSLATATTGAVLVRYQTAAASPIRYVVALTAFGVAGWWAYLAVSFAIGRHKLKADSLLGKFLNAFRSRKSNAVAIESPEVDQTPDEVED